jgi:hypothetical protein
MRRWKMSHEREKIHVCAGRQMSVYNIKIMVFDVIDRFRKMIVGFEMILPGNACRNKRMWLLMLERNSLSQ